MTDQQIITDEQMHTLARGLLLNLAAGVIEGTFTGETLNLVAAMSELLEGLGFDNIAKAKLADQMDAIFEESEKSFEELGKVLEDKEKARNEAAEAEINDD
jgi:hypothetical protein